MQLDPRRGVWPLHAVLMAPFALFLVVATPLLFVVGVADAALEILLAGGLAAAAAIISVYSVTCGYRLARASPAISVSDNGLVLDHPGLFRGPVHLDRSLIHSVYLREFPAAVARPRIEGTRSQRLRSWVKDVDRGVGVVDRPISSQRVPDLSTRLPMEGHNLLVVLTHPTSLAATTRRGLGAMSVPSMWVLYKGPTKGTVARGFFARVEDLPAARRCLSSWASSFEPPAELWRWLHARRDRLRHG